MVPSPSRSSPSEKPHVMFTGMIDREGEKTVRELGGELADSVYNCTHLVTDKVSCVAVITHPPSHSFLSLPSPPPFSPFSSSFLSLLFLLSLPPFSYSVLVEDESIYLLTTPSLSLPLPFSPSPPHSSGSSDSQVLVLLISWLFDSERQLAGSLQCATEVCPSRVVHGEG